MDTKCDLRIARDIDAEDVSTIIQSALRETNARDYSQDIIERIAKCFDPAAVLELIHKRTVFVAALGQRIVGTASLDGRVVQSVFVAPDVQGRGIGKRLMAEVEKVARERGIAVLAVPSSVTAEHFYSKLGFTAVRESYYGEERTIIMERGLAP